MTATLDGRKATACRCGKKIPPAYLDDGRCEDCSALAPGRFARSSHPARRWPMEEATALEAARAERQGRLEELAAQRAEARKAAKAA